ncbi:SDR family oxidoreductase [Halalkalibacillus halophilus]|uniref:SDR family oxidoreductase n=1 Tax=Halalkalibacillus halophilus TaxID=392827 RepID=UPI00042A57D2|nr:SDR family oxidoreductase [Halalkalibacillus halophilus]
MAKTYFFTGFPGFITSNLIKEISTSNLEINKIYLLVLPSMKAKAQQQINELIQFQPNLFNKLKIIYGDITKKHLNIKEEQLAILKKEVTHVFNLAAIYDLAVPRDIAYKVNVEGTNNVNSLAQQLVALEKYVYFSTAYVSGNREGIIYEHELDAGQSFKNHYEETKFKAEKLVADLKPDLPITIIRPGIVVGHSHTGETTKFDGPYFLLNYLDRLQKLPFIPYLGTGNAEANFVPIDYILESTIYLAHTTISNGKTYHLIDPNPYTIKEVYQLLMNTYINKEPRGTLPLLIGKSALSFPTMRKWLKVEKQALAYFNCESFYDCTEAKNDLAEASIHCPDFKDYVPVMVSYYKQHKHDLTKQVPIK